MLSSPPALITVVIPVYNHARYVTQCLDSVLNQTHRPLQLIVIDDGSRDGSPAIVEDYFRCRGEVPGVEIIFRARENRGAHHTLNEGLAAATGEFVAPLNSDDYYHPERLERCLRACESAQADLAFTYVEAVGDDGAVLPADFPWRGWYDEACVKERTEAPGLGFVLLGTNLAVSTGNFFFRRSLYQEIGPFRDYVIAHDLDFLLRAVVVSEPVLLREKLYFYRVHGANTIYAKIQQTEEELARIYAAYLTAVAERPPRNPLAPSPWHWPALFQQALRTPRLARALDRLVLPPAMPAGAESFPVWAASKPKAAARPDAIAILLPELSVTEASRHALGLALLLLQRGHEVEVVSSTQGPMRARFEAAGVRVRVLRTNWFSDLARGVAGLGRRLAPGSRLAPWLRRLGRLLTVCSQASERIPPRFDLPYHFRLLGTAPWLPRTVLVHSFAAWPLVRDLGRVRNFRRIAWLVPERLPPAVMLANAADKRGFAGLARVPTTKFIFASEAARLVWAAAGVDGVTRHWSGRSRAQPVRAPRLAGAPLRSLFAVVASGEAVVERQLLEAFALARRLGWIPEETVLTLAGVGAPSRDASAADLVFRAHQPDLVGRTVLVGPIDDEALDRYVAAADLYLQIEAGEVLPRALVASMAMGLPILLASADAGHEIIAHGQTGWVVSPPSIPTFAAGLAEVVANPERAEAMGRAARVAFEERFCLERTGDGLVADIFG
jgi:glycosyltransferase involved in cell wall biosynthesis